MRDNVLVFVMLYYVCGLLLQSGLSAEYYCFNGDCIVSFISYSQVDHVVWWLVTSKRFNYSSTK